MLHVDQKVPVVEKIVAGWRSVTVELLWGRTVTAGLHTGGGGGGGGLLGSPHPPEFRNNIIKIYSTNNMITYMYKTLFVIKACIVV